jgi:hypothetical protein
MAFVTPNMGLTVPDPGVDTGEGFADNISNDLVIIDNIDHVTIGKRLTSAAFTVTQDLPLNDFNINTIRSVQFISNPEPLNGQFDVNSIYFSNGNLYVNDANGNQIQLTANGIIDVSGVQFNAFNYLFINNINHIITTLETYNLYSISSTTTAVTMTLPAPTLVIPGRFYYFKDVGGAAATNNITIAVNNLTSDSFDNGHTTFVINNNGGYVAVYSRIVDGTHNVWEVFDQNVYNFENIAYNSSTVTTTSGSTLFSGGALIAATGSTIDSNTDTINSTSDTTTITSGTLSLVGETVNSNGSTYNITTGSNNITVTGATINSSGNFIYSGPNLITYSGDSIAGNIVLGNTLAITGSNLITIDGFATIKVQGTGQIQATNGNSIISDAVGGISSNYVGGIQSLVAGGIKPGVASGIISDQAFGILSTVANGFNTNVFNGMGTTALGGIRSLFVNTNVTTSPYHQVIGDDFINVISTYAANFSVVLLDPSTCAGRVVTVQDGSYAAGGTHFIAVTSAGAGFYSGGGTPAIDINKNGGGVRFVSDGTNWYAALPSV